ncbi:hypothetical protein LB507_004520, partial [Fusarium sp. FIESC RH6]
MKPKQEDNDEDITATQRIPSFTGRLTGMPWLRGSRLSVPMGWPW